MKAIFLAAGEGSRLRPLTDELPKCMIPFRGKPLLQYGIDAMLSAGIVDLIVVRGYKKEKIKYGDVKYVDNPRYSMTNMVATLFCAAGEFNDDLLVSYADIVYGPDIVKALIDTPAEIGVVVDKEWFDQWSFRMENPLMDAETLKLDRNSNIIEIGKKPRSYDDIEGQYIGLIKFSRKILPEVQHFYDSLDKKRNYDGKNVDNMYMTTFLQLLADAGFELKAVPIKGGWLEIDTLNDLKQLEESNFLR